MMDIREEKIACDLMVATVVQTLPKISRATITAREPSRMMSLRRQSLSDAIREAEMLAAYLRDRQQALGWKDPRSDAA